MITLESVAIAVLGAVLGMVLGLVIGVLLRQSLKDDLTSLGLPLGQLLVFLVDRRRGRRARRDPPGDPGLAPQRPGRDRLGIGLEPLTCFG